MASGCAGKTAGWKRASDEKTVWMLKGDHLEPVHVKVGITDGTVTEIVEGLNEGDEVVTDSNEPGGAPKQRQGGSPMGGPGGGMRRMF